VQRGPYPMTAKEAIMAFSQSEKIKAGLIWISQGLALLDTLSEAEKRGAEGMVNVIANMILHEIQLAENLTGEKTWRDAQKHIEQAVVMIRSHVASESVVHLTQALSQVTVIGQRSMSLLKEMRLL
jgi:hypothetical protein